MLVVGAMFCRGSEAPANKRERIKISFFLKKRNIKEMAGPEKRRHTIKALFMQSANCKYPAIDFL
jgi:hypothetical protein